MTYPHRQWTCNWNTWGVVVSQDITKLTEEILSEAKSAGASLAGVGDLNLLRELPTFGGLSLDKFTCAVSVAVVLPSQVIEMITADDPGILYAWAYKTGNLTLENITFRVASKISGWGYRALVIPPSMRVNHEKEVGHASQKAFAWAAGLGWIGRNALLVTPQYGPRVRLATVLTDMPLRPGEPIKNMCDDCIICVKACPAKALKPVKFKVRPSSREEILDVKRCADRLSKTKEVLASKYSSVDYGVEICGICIKACPYGRFSN